MATAYILANWTTSLISSFMMSAAVMAEMRRLEGESESTTS